MSNMHLGGGLIFLAVIFAICWIVRWIAPGDKRSQPLDTLPQAKRDPKSVRTIDLK